MQRKKQRPQRPSSHCFKSISLLFLALLLCGCMGNGYGLKLYITNADPAVMSVKALLERQGFLFLGNHTAEKAIYQTKVYELVERYGKEPPGIERSFFSRKRDYLVHVDIVYSGYSRDSYRDVEIWIYNVYDGNDPLIKPAILEAATEIERTIQEAVPDMKIIRRESLPYVIPFI